MAPDSDTATPVLKVSDRAREMVIGVRAEEPDADRLALWLEVSGASPTGFTYDMYFQALSDAGAGDAVAHHDDLAVVVPEASVERLRGATLDISGEGEAAGMVVINPNNPPSARATQPEGDVSSPLALKVIEVLETQINPSIASHGGRADLVSVEDGTAYLRLGGGCQGCGMAQVTLSQGIEVAIKDAVPEITAVVDVTDHASGSNPYFETAKK
ncbi:MAG: NifU family protein [Acidimicrobiales bacterium]